jgi:hypothetical protein
MERPSTLTSMKNLAAMLSDRGKHQEAELTPMPVV